MALARRHRLAVTTRLSRIGAARTGAARDVGRCAARRGQSRGRAPRRGL